jgi:predicted AAA+ superfamily ATPase
MYIKRELQKKLVKFMAVPEILAVVGARQVGKTTLIENVLENITNKKIKKISFDNINILNEFVDNIDSFIKLYIEPNDILFIDELHYAKDSGRLLKYIYDTKKKNKNNNFRFISCRVIYSKFKIFSWKSS